LGACLGCPVTLKNENGDYYYRQVCRDGPVFDAQEVFFDGC
ncbi:MAG: dihydroorotate dehydrogenase electron transfer subunit, partial [Firmicutes bacterium]|nr:dihydroorotate dehydrogenase electron transfer subunit [Bacillota bacterium]